uniref:Sushi domain containing 5 n=1 Tax=Labrus bergylta TaxID=56723 RepID=A0A3Q3GSC0_9LABR
SSGFCPGPPSVYHLSPSSWPYLPYSKFLLFLGRVFVLNLRNSSGLQGFRDAERACASQHARLASAQELHHAVVECFFSPCTRGWLYGGSVGTTVCNIVGSAFKAVDVRTQNATEDAANLNAFCIKDRDVPCGDPPSFPNAHLQEHSGYEMGDELLYTCVPGYLMPSRHKAFSLLCDSCGEWYGLVEICVKDETEGHVDYEDTFPDSYGEKEHQDQREEHDADGEVTGRNAEGVERDEERPVEDFIGHPRWEQERREVVTTDAAPATQAPVSLLSQKHLFWFPSEAFQEQGPVSTNPVTQTTQRASGAQSEESKEQESQEGKDHHQHPAHTDDHDMRHTVHDLPGETGERDEMEGELGEVMCTGENCTAPPPSSSSRGPTVAAIIAVVCMVAAAVFVGVWCYRRQRQKSSMYEMNGKGQSQSQSRQGQQIEMQQKV